MTRVIYVTSDCAESFDFNAFNALSDKEKLSVAYNNEGMRIYTLYGFQFLFNSDLISDLGYIFIVNEES